jgi:hypothetical protein
MSEPQGIYKLPRELRDQIYDDYFALDGGDTLNPCTNKLTTTNGDRIDLSLRSTCQLIAHETRGTALKSNAVHASTFYSRELRTRAGHFNVLLKMIGAWKAEFLLRHNARTNGIAAAIYNYVEELLRICGFSPGWWKVGSWYLLYVEV